MAAGDPAAPAPLADLLGLATRSHPLRASLSHEMHIRRLPRFAAPARLLQIVTLLGEGGAPASHAHVAGLCHAAQLDLADDAKFALVPIDGMHLVWERHTEAASYTFVLPGAFDTPFGGEPFLGVRAVIDAIPGAAIRATQVALLGRDADPPDALIDRYFMNEGLVACEVDHGKARIWSDFRLNGDGFGRLLIADRGLIGDETAQLVQRLQELGNYRNLALLGLPLAQRLTPDVSRLEQRLAVLTHGVSERDADDDGLLDELTYLSGELARIVAETRYRMNATRAYAQICADRLDSLAVTPIPGYQTLADFTARRLMPAVRTCESFSARLEDLSQRAGRTSSLLRTRIDTALARQNRDLLASMDKRTDVQLRLQQTVEGLSVVAISYYLVALIGDMLHAFPAIPHDAAVALSVPIVLLIVALVMRRVRSRLGH